jgi:uncharacterized protein (DUF58 family)
MIVPNGRLLWWAGGTVLPLTLAVAVAPAALPLVGAFLGVVGAIVVLDAVLAGVRRRGLGGDFPERVKLNRNREGAVEFTLRHGGGTGCRLLLGLELPAGIDSPLDSCPVVLPAGGERVRLDWPLTGRVRGRFLLGRCHFRVVSPLGLWSGQGSFPAGTELSVYPDLAAERKKLAALFLNRDATPLHPRRQVGQGKEFEKLRAYLPGDSLGDIHWKATAKRGHPVTKEHRIERTQEVYVAIDASRLSARGFGEDGAEAVLEQYITAALTLGMIAQHQGDLFGLVTFSDQVLNFVRAGTGRGHFGVCRDALYRLHPQPVTPDFGELAASLTLRLRRRALVIVLTALDEPTVAEQFSRTIGVVSRRHLVLVTMIRPDGARPAFAGEAPAGVNDLYRCLGGHLLWHALAEQKKSLRQRGVDFSLLDQGRLAADLISRYIDVKRRQIL